jgi:hypothetical protein
MSLPKHFCWTRFGTEAGETIDRILERKESERQRNGGIFLWGIGNAIGPSMRELLLVERTPEVIFSPIRSNPKREDAQPSTVIAWRAGRDLDGRPCRLPDWSVVTSRGPSGIRPHKHHALVCYSDTSLHVSTTSPAISFGGLRNLLSGNAIGASQVTAVVRYECIAFGAQYPASIRTRLVAPFLVELCEPQVIAGHKMIRPTGDSIMSGCRDGGVPSLFTLEN